LVFYERLRLSLVIYYLRLCIFVFFNFCRGEKILDMSVLDLELELRGGVMEPTLQALAQKFNWEKGRK